MITDRKEILIKTRQVKSILQKIETKESARSKLMRQVGKLDIDIIPLFIEMNKLNKEIFILKNGENNNVGVDDANCDDVMNIVD